MTTPKKASEAALRSAVSTLVRESLWGVSLGANDMLTVEFGEAKPTEHNEVIHGSWHLWLYDCGWEIGSADQGVWCRRSDAKDAKAGIENIGVWPVASAELTCQLSIKIKTANGLFIQSIQEEESTFEQWILFMPDGRIFSVGPGLTIECEQEG